MLEVHRCRQIDWSPTAVVALATSVNGEAVAVGRENGAIEVWRVAAGSVGWHCDLKIPGRQDASLSSLVWCRSEDEDAAPLGRLFSAGLDGFVTEWDLLTLQPKAVVESMGGSVWQLAAEHVLRTSKGSNVTSQVRATVDENESEDENSSSSSDSDEEPENREQRVALACEDGCLRIFEVSDAQQGIVYCRSFPRVEGRLLSVAWTWDGTRLVAGGSDGCIRCWDVATAREIYRITSGIGGKGTLSDLCIWSLLVLRNGDIVSGDSSGSTQFWDGQLGTLLQVHTRHRADVLALAASPSHRTVFAGGADGQVIQFQQLDQSMRLAEDAIDITQGALGDRWVYVGGKRTHTHDVRALAVAFPVVIDEDMSAEKKQQRKWRKKNQNSVPTDYRRWAQSHTAMLISGGNDAKLFTYPANSFLSFHPHDVCPAPERPYIQLAQSGIQGGTLMMTQHCSWVDVWKVYTTDSTAMPMINGNVLENGSTILGKRKWEGESDSDSLFEEPLSNGHGPAEEEGSRACIKYSNGHVAKRSIVNGQVKEVGKSQGTPPAHLARIKCKSADHIICSAISSDGRLIAFSDSQRPRLYEVHQQVTHTDLGDRQMWDIKRRKLPAVLRAAHCMEFSVDSLRLLVAGPHGQISVVDTKSREVVHTFQVPSQNTDPRLASALLTNMCCSPDGQWVAAATNSGHIVVFNMETLRHQWTVPVLDGTPATAMVFHPGSSNVLIVSSAANQIHVLDVEMRAPGEWSKRNGTRIAKKLLEFPGGISGLSLPISPESTSLIAYSSSAMCHIDFSKPIRAEVEGGHEHPTRTGKLAHGNGESHAHANGNGKMHDTSHRVRTSVGTNFVVIPFKHPVLFLGHTGPNSVLVVEKPWLEVLRQLPAPVFRHVYGS